MRRDPAFVYFVRPVGMDGPIKIGCSQNPVSRLVSLMSWSPFALELIITAPGGYPEEARLHAMFAADRLRPEWFRTTRDLLCVIQHVRDTGALPFDNLLPWVNGALFGLIPLLERQGVSLEDFAREAGVKRSRVLEWCRYPPGSALGRVMHALHVFNIEASLEKLLTGPAVTPMARRAIEPPRPYRIPEPAPEGRAA